MMHRIEKIKITDSFETTVEITGNEKSGKVVIFSHGFGVKRDNREIFTDIENIIQTEFLCVRFEYNDIKSNGDMTVHAFSQMAKVLEKVLVTVEDEFKPKEKYIIAHSLGSVVVALEKPVGYESIILLAPPPSSFYDGLLDYYTAREGSMIDLKGTSKVERSDGSITSVDKEFFEEIRLIEPQELYKGLNKITNLSFVVAEKDQILTQSYGSILQMPDIRFIEVHGANHDFSGKSRVTLLSSVKNLLQLDEEGHEIIKQQ